MPRKVIWSALVFALAAALFYLGRTETFSVRAQAAITVTPFTAQLITVSYKDNSKGLVTEQRTMVRRSDGSEAIMGTSPLQPSAPAIRRIDLIDGHTGMFADWIMSKMTGRKPSKEVAARKAYLSNPPVNCVNPAGGFESLLGTDTLLGLQVYKIQASKAGAPFNTTQWRAPGLACYALRTEMFKPDGSPYVQQYATFVQVGEPGSVLFDSGSTYSEMKPSEMRKTIFSRMGVDESNCASCFSDISKDDAKYTQMQTP